VRMLFITKGHSAPETNEATYRAVALAEKSGNLRQLVNLIIARGITAAISGEITAAGALADRALELGVREATPSILGRVHLLQMMVRHYRGDLVGAEKHFGSGLEFFDHPSVRRISGVTVAAFNYGSASAWMSGRGDVARDRMARMNAASGSNPYDDAFSLHFAAQLQTWMREYEQAQASAARVLELSDKHQFLELATPARCVLLLVRAQMGRTTEGLVLIRREIAGMSRRIGSDMRLSNLYAYLGEAQRLAGATEEALETIEKSLNVNPEERVYRPETLRIRGELRLEQGRRELAEADFREAIALAQSMSAKAWELRATTSLARLLRDTDRRDEARTMLADIYNWFTEGFDTADLKDAKALLDELAG
jgi:tetratricopeptide (TPR) repeat protein